MVYHILLIPIVFLLDNMIPSKTFVFPNLLPLLVLLLDLLAFLDDRLRPRHTTTLCSHGPPMSPPTALLFLPLLLEVQKEHLVDLSGDMW